MLITEIILLRQDDSVNENYKLVYIHTYYSCYKLTYEHITLYQHHKIATQFTLQLTSRKSIC